MGMPQKLLDFTSPIVNKALETGARGSTTTNTDYGVIGDAMFKKAQLDLGIAKLHSDAGIQKAQIMSGLAMDKANLNLQTAGMLMDNSIKLRQLNLQEHANDASDGETLMGVIQGAATGGAAGFAMGGPPGAIAGAVLGGGTTYMGYQSGGRAGGQQALQTVGAVSNLGMAVKTYSDGKKAKDAYGGWVDAGLAITKTLNNPGSSPEQRQAAAMEWDQHLGNGRKVMVDMGMNPQQADVAIQSYKKSMSDPSGMMDGKDKQLVRNAIEAQSNPDFSPTAPPEKQRAAVKNFLAKQSMAFAAMTGGKEMTPSMMIAASEQAQTGMGDITAKMLKGGKFKGAAANQPIQVHDMDHTDPTTLSQYAQNKITDPQAGNPIAPAPAGYTSGNNTSAGQPFRQPTIQKGGGVAMDDGQPVITEQKLAEQGADAVKVLDKTDTQLGAATVDKAAHGSTGSFADDGGFHPAKGEDSKFVDKINKDNAKVDSELPEKIKETRSSEAAELTMNIDKMLDKIKSGDVKTFGKKGAAFGKSVSDTGVELKVPFGGPSLGTFGKDAQWASSPEEQASWNEIQQLSEMNASQFARLSGEKGALSEQDIQRFKKLTPSPGKTRLQNIQGLVDQKELILNKLKAKVLSGQSLSTDLDIQKKQNQIQLQNQKLNGGAKKPMKGNYLQDLGIF